MKRSTLLSLMLALPFIAGLILTGCKKDQSEQLSPADEQEMADYSALSETESEMVSNDIFDNVVGVNSEVGLGGTGVFGRQSSGSTSKDMGIDSLPACLNITVTRLNLPEPFPVRITLDFGAGCPGNDGHTRSGRSSSPEDPPLPLLTISGSIRYRSRVRIPLPTPRLRAVTRPASALM